ncbi:Hypothetical protein, putative [Bodo saltans]|uniref:EF-hand domain-containing protein n=1 Tax=Bodo saltans TaxID=75058 RepID=A0A0S4J574_BODSA|nr:Hypothetical protein, putative [Bodo saltans]|eukprot:CUG81200.1 Hypothetical protein, putative [Bodo saltans]
MKFTEYSSTIPKMRSAANVLQLEAKRMYLRYRVKELYANADPGKLWSLLLTHRYKRSSATSGEANADDNGGEDLRLDYGGFRAVAYELMFGTSDDLDDGRRHIRKEHYFQHPFLSPGVFLEFGKMSEDSESDGTISAVPLYAYIAKRMLLFRLRVELELCGSVAPTLHSASPTPVDAPRCTPSLTAPQSNGLTVEDLEGFIADLIPNLRIVRDMPPWMLPYYLCHASRKFFFLCDPRGTGAINIDTLMKSDVFSELLRLYESDLQDATIAFPAGTVVEIPKQRFVDVALVNHSDHNIAPIDDGDEEELIRGIVEGHDNEGNVLSDMYRIRVEGESIGADHAGLVVAVPRACVYWTVHTSDSLSPELLAQDNWFSLPLMHRVYEHFTSLDADGDGVLTEIEFARYSNDSYTPLAVHRVFECYVSGGSGGGGGDGDVDIPPPTMDFKGFLNFVVATEHPHTFAAKRYLWRLLDIDDTRSHITIDALRCFTKEVSTMLVKSGLMTETHHISSTSILSEVVDMINPSWHEHVTTGDLDRCKQHAIVLLVLLNFRSFYAYDCREQSAASTNDAYVGS